ncbi:MAG: dihydrodipicolinate synthase family protein [Planctomycetota bacterium]
MSNEVPHGVVVPVITPLDAAEDVDAGVFRKVLRRLVDLRVHAIFVGGSAGEGPLLAAAQWRRMAETAVDEVGAELPLLGGVMETSTRRVCEKIKVLKGLGYRYLVLTPTFYIPGKTAGEHLRLFGAAKEAAVDTELIAYNIPQCTGSSLAVDTVCEMARRGWIRCCKESSGDWGYLKGLLQRAPDAGLTVLAGDEHTAGEALLAGAGGIVPVCANYDLGTFLRLYEAGRRGDRSAVGQLMARVEVLRETLPLSGPCWLSGIKYALAVLGLGSGRPLSPLEPCDPQRMARIATLIEKDKLKS